MKAVLTAAVVALSLSSVAFAYDKSTKTPKNEKACTAAAKKTPDAGWTWDKATKKCTKAETAAADTAPTTEAAPATEESAEGGSY